MNSGSVPSREPDSSIAVVRSRQLARGGRGQAGRDSRPVVVVLGMHRSGTSLLSNLLHYLGVDMADTSDVVSKRNPGGHWERPELNDIQDAILATLGRPVASPLHALPFPPAWWRRKEIQAIKPRLVDFVERELAKSPELWGFKDPRTCRLLPLWWEVFRELDLSPVYIHAIRSPSESAVSMALKNRTRPISASQGELMWLAYNYDVLRYVTIEQPATLIVNYAEWFDDGPAVARRLAEALHIGGDLSEEELRECVESVVRGDYRHQRDGQGDAVSRMPIAAMLYDAMLAEQRGVTSGVRALKNQLPFVKLLMKSAEPIVTELANAGIAAETIETVRADHGDRVEALDQEIANLNKKVLTARGEAERLRELADVAGKIAALDARVGEITTGDIGAKIAAVDKRVREMRTDVPIKLEEIEHRLTAIAEDPSVFERLGAIERRLFTLPEDEALRTRLDLIGSRIATLADGSALDARLAAIEQRLGPADGETLASGLAAVRSSVAALTEDRTIPVRLTAIEQRLAFLVDDRSLGTRLAAIEDRLGHLADSDPLGVRLDGLAETLKVLGDGSSLAPRLVAIETMLAAAADDATVPTRLDGIELRLGALGAGIAGLVDDRTVSVRLAAIDQRLATLADDDALGARFDGLMTGLAAVGDDPKLVTRLEAIEARLGAVAEGEALGGKLDAIETRLGSLANGDVLAERFDAVAAQLVALLEAGARAERSGNEDARRAERVGALEDRTAQLAGRARKLLAAARAQRAAAAGETCKADRAAQDRAAIAARAAVERERTYRLSAALVERDGEIVRLRSRLAESAPAAAADGDMLAWPTGDDGGAAEAYGYDGAIESVDTSGIAGWVRFATRPDLVPVVELAVDGHFVSAQACIADNDRYRFLLDWRDVPVEYVGRQATMSVAGIGRAITGPACIVPGGKRMHAIPAKHAAELFGGTADEAEDYWAWLAQHGEDVSVGAAQAFLAGSDRPWPMISVVVFGHDDGDTLATTIRALHAQVYPYWEALCIDAPDTVETLDPRARAVAHGRLRDLATGEHIAFIECGDAIARTALLHLAVAATNAPGFALIYSDEDLLDPSSGMRGLPYMKGAWSDDLALAQDFVSRLALIPQRLLPEKSVRLGVAAIHELVTGIAVMAPDAVVHLPFVLYHRSIANRKAAAQVDFAAVAERLAVKAPGRFAGVTVDRDRYDHRRLRWPLTDPAPRVTLVVPTRDRVDLLKVCVGGILGETDYPDIEVLIADNDSAEPETHAYFEEVTRDPRVRVIPCPGVFNYSAINNRAAAQANGSVLGFLNNDLKVADPDWLRLMTENAMRPGVGIVGAKLLYGDDTVQHAGLVLGIGIASHIYRRFSADAPGRWGRLRTTQDVSAVTAACLLMPRTVWEQVGGLDESFPIAYNDVDLCLKVLEAGYRIVWSADAVVYHLESQSRGKDVEADKRDRLDEDQERFTTRWAKRLAADPFYSPNLAVTHVDARLAFPPRVLAPWEATDGSKS